MKKVFVVVISTILGVVVGVIGANKIIRKKTEKAYEYSNKHLTLYLMMNQWVKVKQEKKSIADYMEKNEYKKIAIYGMHYAGETLLNEFAGSNVRVCYGIDKSADDIHVGVDVLKPDEELPEVDAVIITAITYYDEIEEMLSMKVDCPILSLEDILYDI